METIVSAVVALIVAALTAVAGFQLQKDRLRAEMRTQFMAEEAIRQLLQHPVESKGVVYDNHHCNLYLRQ